MNIIKYDEFEVNVLYMLHRIGDHNRRLRNVPKDLPEYMWIKEKHQEKGDSKSDATEKL